MTVRNISRRPSPSPRVCTDVRTLVRWRHNYIFLAWWVTNFSYPWCFAGALRALKLRYKTHIDRIQTKQNHSARLIFFATTYGEHIESALPLLNLSDVLTVHNVYRFEILKFTYLWHKGVLQKLFSNYFQYTRNVHKYNTRYASRQNLYVKKVRTYTGKQTIGYAACIIWDKIPFNLKELNIYQFSKQLKPYLLLEQHS